MSEGKVYKLPDWLGGLPVSRIVLADSVDPKVTVMVETDGAYATIGLDKDQLVEVSPPLPAEPRNNTDWRARQAVFSRRDQWTESNGERHWYANIGEAKYFPCDWEDVLAYAGERGALIELVPDPAVESPDLPYVDPLRNIRVRVQWGSIGDPYLEACFCGDPITYAADDGLNDLDQLIAALSRGRAQLHAELNGSSPSALRAVRPEGENNK